MVHSDSSSPTLFLSCFPLSSAVPFLPLLSKNSFFKAEIYLVQIACATMSPPTSNQSTSPAVDRPDSQLSYVTPPTVTIPILQSSLGDPGYDQSIFSDDYAPGVDDKENHPPCECPPPQAVMDELMDRAEDSPEENRTPIPIPPMSGVQRCRIKRRLIGRVSTSAPYSITTSP